MSRYDRSHMIATYIDDLGTEHKNQAFKIQGNAPLISTFYQARAKAVCSGGKFFKFRNLVATFEDGRKLQYPLPDPGNAISWTEQLIGAGAVCVDLEGEEWGFIPKTLIPGSYRSSPYSGLPPRKVYESISFEYTPSTTGIDALRLSTRIPTDSGELNTCQKAGLAGIEEGAGICNAAGIVEPRRLIIQARSIDSFNSAEFQQGAIRRNAIVSSPLAVVATGGSIVNCAECLGYKGESITAIHALVPA